MGQIFLCALIMCMVWPYCRFKKNKDIDGASIFIVGLFSVFMFVIIFKNIGLFIFCPSVITILVFLLIKWRKYTKGIKRAMKINDIPNGPYVYTGEEGHLYEVIIMSFLGYLFIGPEHPVIVIKQIA